MGAQHFPIICKTNNEETEETIITNASHFIFFCLSLVWLGIIINIFSHYYYVILEETTKPFHKKVLCIDFWFKFFFAASVFLPKLFCSLFIFVSQQTKERRWEKREKCSDEKQQTLLQKMVFSQCSNSLLWIL